MIRLAFGMWSGRQVGGAETYLAQVIPALAGSGYEIGVLTEVDGPVGRERIDLPLGAPSWNVEREGELALARMREWHPDLVFSHGVVSEAVEEALLEAAPSVLFPHNYYGTCASGNKAWRYPLMQPANCVFGSRCLLHYYPRGCGGRSPATLLRTFSRQRGRHSRLARYAAIVTASEHMRAEYERNGVSADRLHVVHYPVPGAGTERFSGPVDRRRSLWESDVVRLLFVGRMDPLKGGGILIDALPMIAEKLNGRLELTLVGDGPARQSWEGQAAKVAAEKEAVITQFVGWKTKQELGALYASSQLLVVPSLWPEPFGLVGPEAGLHGVPAAAFDVGGIRDWLIDGRNGFLAAAEPPSAMSLAMAVIKCVSDEGRWQTLAVEARNIANSFTLERHVGLLTKVFAGLKVGDSVSRAELDR